MDLPEKKQRWVFHADALPQPAGAGVTRRVLAYTDGLMCVENTFETGAVGALHRRAWLCLHRSGHPAGYLHPDAGRFRQVKRFGDFCNRSSKKAVRRVGRTAL